LLDSLLFRYHSELVKKTSFEKEYVRGLVSSSAFEDVNATVLCEDMCLENITEEKKDKNCNIF
jgi:hypothetical protein